MYQFISVILNKYQAFLYIFLRMTGIFIITPIFSRKNIPAIYKICFSFFTALLLVNIVDISNVNNEEFSSIIVMFEELFVGFIIGFISYIFFISLYIAGQIIDMQIGFGMVNVFDPQSNAQVPIIGNFYYIIALLFFLTIDGHHILINSLTESYSILPLGVYSFNIQTLYDVTKVFGQVFIIGFKICSPILGVIFLINVFLGILARTVPQMNVFIVGMPLKIIVGITTLIIVSPLYLLFLEYVFDNMYGEIFKFLRIIGEG